MGLDADGVAVLALARAAGADFTTTATLGRQGWFVRPRGLQLALKPFGFDLTETQAIDIIDGREPSRVRAGKSSPDGFFTLLGAEQVDSIDTSDFEGATIVHDLNTPVPDDLAGRFTLLFDGGTLEHVFDVRQAMDNAMRLVAPGGHFVSAVPTNNQMGHGFYQFSPELYFRLFCPENGFETKFLLIKELSIRPHWYQLADPAVIGRRVTLSTMGEANMFIIARRVGEAGLNTLPMQSDYAARWSQDEDSQTVNKTATAPRSSWPGRLGSLPINQNFRRSMLRTAQQLRILFGSVASSPGVERVDLAQLAAAQPENL